MSDFNRVLLLNEAKNPLALCDKIEAHKKGLFHLAFSIFIFDSAGRMLLQKRNRGKYHSGGLWSNACCSHPETAEDAELEAETRLYQEMGFSCPLTYAFSFGYRAEFADGLVENEWDMVFIGRYSGEAPFDPDEVEDCRWADTGELIGDVAVNPERYTAWLKASLARVLEFRDKQRAPRKREIRLSRRLAGKKVALFAQNIGDGLSAACFGGDSPHIGAVSVALPAPDEKHGVATESVSTITLPGHRDDTVSQMLSRQLCKALKGPVTVTCGIHYDLCPPALIKEAVRVSGELCDELIRQLTDY